MRKGRLLTVGFIFVASLVAAQSAAAQSPIDPFRAEECALPCGLGTEQLGIKEGQGARLELQNKGDEPVTALLRFVDGQGATLFERETTIEPGKAEAVNAFHPGGANLFGLRAQFGARARGSLILLRPSLHVVEKSSGKRVRLIGPQGFKESRLATGAK